MRHSNLGNSGGNEIKLIEIFDLLYKSKKTIFVITLFFSIVTIIFVLSKEPIYKSSALIKIGEYVLNENETPLENSSQLYRNLLQKYESGKIVQNQNIKISFEPYGANIIQVESKSNSIESNINSINEILSYSLNHHQNLFKNIFIDDINHIKNQLNSLKRSEINLKNQVNIMDKKIKIAQSSKNKLETLISEFEANPKNQLTFLKSWMIHEVSNRKIQLLDYNDQRNQYNSELFRFEQNSSNKINDLKIDLERLENAKFNDTMLLKDVKSNRESNLFILISGFLLGFFTSIMYLIGKNLFYIFKKQKT